MGSYIYTYLTRFKFWSATVNNDYYFNVTVWDIELSVMNSSKTSNKMFWLQKSYKTKYKKIRPTLHSNLWCQKVWIQGTGHKYNDNVINAALKVVIK